MTQEQLPPSPPAPKAQASLLSAFSGGGLSWGRRLAFTALAATLATAIWLPTIHLFFSPPGRAPASISPRTRALAARHLRLWSAAEARRRALDTMRISNPEWDFMGRTFLVLALANMALREAASKTSYLGTIDRIIDDTLRLERDKGMFYFLMSYARARPFVDEPPRSLFIDGEIALMLGARRVIREKPAYRDLFKERIAIMTGRMAGGPVSCAESYPNECWMFCNTIALAAIKIADVLDRQDHSAFFARWIRTAKAKLIDPKTGILNSSFTLTGMTKDGPEGSSIWLSAHCLQLIDAELARDQYQRARRELGREVLGFGYAREWPSSRQGPPDIDSGPIIPGLEASPGSSGLALLAAAAFGDASFYDALSASLDFAALPVRDHGSLRYTMSNQLGDAVVLYAAVVGPLWHEIQRRAQR